MSLRGQGLADALTNISKVAKGVDSKTMSLKYFETLSQLGASASTKFIFPMEFTEMLKPFLGMAKGDSKSK